MNRAAKEARNEYARKWRQQNPDKVKQYRESYWQRKAAEAKQEKERGGAPIEDR